MINKIDITEYLNDHPEILSDIWMIDELKSRGYKIFKKIFKNDKKI